MLLYIINLREKELTNKQTKEKENINQMAITVKTLTAFVFTVIFIISYVHCNTITASAPGRSKPIAARGKLYQPFSNFEPNVLNDLC